MSQTHLLSSAAGVGPRTTRLTIVVLACLLLTACLTTTSTKPVDKCVENPQLLECVCRAAPEQQFDRCVSECGANRSSRECACLLDPQSTACVDPCALDPGAPECCPDEPAEDSVKQAITALSFGGWTEGRRLVQCALNREPGNLRAQKMQRQLQLTPVEYFGTARSTDYVVVPGDTLASIAQRCLRDADKFVALAGFNNMTDPSDLSVGQRIRIPGTRPCMDAQEALAEALALEQQGDIEGAYEALKTACRYARTPDIEEPCARLERRYIRELHRKAADLSKAGDCPAAKAIWQQILRIDKNNALAQDSLKYAPC